MKMMEDTGEDVLRQKPNIVVTFFRRLGQVRTLGLPAWVAKNLNMQRNFF